MFKLEWSRGMGISETIRDVNTRKAAIISEIFEHFDQESDSRTPTDTLQ